MREVSDRENFLSAEKKKKINKPRHFSKLS